MSRSAPLAWLFGTFAASLIVLSAGCGNSSVVCDPECPDGTTCTENGCIPNGPEVDLATGPAGDMAVSCSPACAGATPYCNPQKVCVPCLTDEHCPMGSQCKVVGNSALCVPGCNDDARCGGGTKRCCNGSCLDTSSDAANCGACGTACAVPNSTAKCVGSACVSNGCNTGWGDCNQNSADGCETNLHVDTGNCGACGTKCAFKNGTAGCADACYLASCTFGFDDCNGEEKDGCETSVLSDKRNCGACGSACPAWAHSTVDCINARCQLTKCDVGYTDCDGNPANGCEAATGTDAKNCGRCGNVCPQGLVCTNGGCTCPMCNFANAKSVCVNNVCMLDQCLAGWGNCDNNNNNGCETNFLSDANNCTGCGIVCPQNKPYCVNGVCDVSSHNIMKLVPDAFNNPAYMGCGDNSNFWTQNFGQMNYDQCEELANKYGAQFMGMTGYFANYNAQYAATPRWVGEADTNNAYVGTANWSQVTSTPRGNQSACVLAYANSSMPGNGTFNTTWQSSNGKAYQVQDFGSISEKTCYTNAAAAGARPLNPWMFQQANKNRAHMVENHQNHGSTQYTGLNAYSSDGACAHTYTCLVGYNP